MTFASLAMLALVFVMLYTAQELFHRYAKFAFVFFAAVALVLFNYWTTLISLDNWFPWLKVVSVVLAVLIFSRLRYKKIKHPTLLKGFVWFFLSINIIEAVALDIQTGALANYFNATAGILLILTLSKLDTIHINTESEYNDLYWSGVTLPWIFGYTLWNRSFVYLNLGESAFWHFAVLGAAFVVAFIDKARWLQTRAYTLATYFLVLYFFSDLSFDTSLFAYNNNVGLLLGTASLTFMVIYGIFFVKDKVVLNKG